MQNKNIQNFIVYAASQIKQNWDKNLEKKHGFKREHAMMYSTQKPLQKHFDLGKTDGRSV